MVKVTVFMSVKMSLEFLLQVLNALVIPLLHIYLRFIMTITYHEDHTKEIKLLHERTLH